MRAHAVLLLSLIFAFPAPRSPGRNRTPEQAKSAPALTILFFTAPWCEPCRAVSPILERFAQRNQEDVKLTAIDFDRAKGLAARWDVQQIPVVIVLSAEGKVLLRYEGANRQSLSTLDAALEDLRHKLRNGR